MTSNSPAQRIYAFRIAIAIAVYLVLLSAAWASTGPIAATARATRGSEVILSISLDMFRLTSLKIALLIKREA